MSVRLFGAGIVLTSALTVSGTNTLFQGVTTYTAPFTTTIPAGVYDFFSFNATFNLKVRQALRSQKHASLTAPATDDLVLFKTVFPTAWSSTPNANKLVLTFAPTGFVVTAGSLQTTISAFILDNPTGAVLTKLGICVETATNSNGQVAYTPASPNATLATITGTFQPRSIFVFENSFKDTWDSEVRPIEATIQLRDGKVRRWSQGSMEAYREITLVDQLADIAGYPLDMRTFSSLNANRVLITVWAPNIAQFTNVSNISTNPGLSVGDIIRIGSDDHWSRVQAISATTVTMQEKLSSGLTPTAGDSIWQLSEAHALWIEAYRTDYFFVYEPDESSVGGSNFKPLAYKLNLNGRHELNFQRLDQFLSLFSVVFPLTRANTPETVLV